MKVPQPQRISPEWLGHFFVQIVAAFMGTGWKGTAVRKGVEGNHWGLPLSSRKFLMVYWK